jgi:hypothetical protein
MAPGRRRGNATKAGTMLPNRAVSATVASPRRRTPMMADAVSNFRARFALKGSDQGRWTAATKAAIPSHPV